MDHDSPTPFPFPTVTLTPTELHAFREKTTRVSREKWRKLCAEGKSPRFVRLVGGPLDGVPTVFCDPSPGIIGWCFASERGLVVPHYHENEDGEWLFED